MTCARTVTLGAYLLGALEPPERYEFEGHIAGCDNCRAELVRLAPLPGMLNQISVEDFDEGLPPGELYPTAPMPVQALTAPEPRRVGPPPDLLDPPTAPQPVAADLPDPPEVPDQARWRARRMWQVAAAAVVVVAVVVAGMFGWRALRHPPPAEEPGITWTGTASATDISADVRLIDHEWGTELQITMANVPPNRECYVVVFDHYGHRQVAGWWGTDHAADEAIPASTSIHRGKIEKLVFLLEDKVPFLTVYPPSG